MIMAFAFATIDNSPKEYKLISIPTNYRNKQPQRIILVSTDKKYTKATGSWYYNILGNGQERLDRTVTEEILVHYGCLAQIFQ